MLYFHYCKKGRPINDFLIEEEYKKILIDGRENIKMHFWYSTDNIFIRVKLGIVKGELDYTNIVFIFEDKEIKVNRFGAIQDWPDGFCDTSPKLAEELLCSAMKKKRLERG